MSEPYPHHPGFKGSVSTGREGADNFAPKLGLRQREVLDALATGPKSADAIAAQIGRHWYLTRPRVSELKAMGLATETGERVHSAMGGATHVVRLTTAAERAAFQAEKEGVNG